MQDNFFNSSTRKTWLWHKVFSPLRNSFLFASFFMSREKVLCQKINKRVASESRCLKLKKRLLLGSSPSCLSPTWGGGEDVRSRSNHRRGFHRRPTTPFTCIWSRSSGTTPTRCSRSRSSGRGGRAKARFTRGLRCDRKKDTAVSILLLEDLVWVSVG